MEKTDLKKIISVSGEHGLYEYVAQTRNGIIAQSLITGQRKAFGPSSKVSSLSDISIYTEDGEVSMKQVLEAIAEKAMEKGIKFYIGNEDVWLTVKVPPELLVEVGDDNGEKDSREA